MSEWVVRFSKRQRIEHVSVMLLFTILAITGFPQKYFDAGWARFLIDLCGGLDSARFLHRIAGILFAVFTAIHLGIGTFLVATGRAGPSLVPIRRDFTDAIQQLRYYMGVEEQPARFDRFDYRQKFEYWGLVMGGTVMISTGFTLYMPILVSRFLPGELIPVAKVAHSNEGLLALLVVIVWHVFNAHLSPDVFPFDVGVFTGKISRERMIHEHPLELARIEGKDPSEYFHHGHAASGGATDREGGPEGGSPPEHA
jgi:cytochrome b subunit of formate dehydrogenase